MRTPLFALLPVLLAIPGSAQIVISTTDSPTSLVQNVLLGGGLTATNITFNGVAGTTLNNQIGSFDGTNCNIGLPSGVILGTGNVHDAEGPNNSGSATLGGGNYGASDPDLVMLTSSGGTTQTINDKAVLEFDFIPTGDSLKFNFVFGSDEYLEFVNSINDVFGFFLSGPDITGGPYSNGAINIALVPNTTSPISINNVNNAVNSQYYVNNGTGYNAPYNSSSFYVQYDGFTVVMTARHAVTCGLTYHIKIAIGDASDTAYDSAVFLQAGSFTSTGQIVPTLGTGVNMPNDSTMLEGCGEVPFSFRRVGDTTNIDTIHLTVGGTATPGVDYYPPFPAELIYQPGDTVINFPLTVPYDADSLETMTIQLVQNVVCSGMQVTNNYTFYIDQFPPLNVVTQNVNGLCGQSYVLSPQVTAGAGSYGYLWSTGETTPSITVSVDTTTTFYVTVTDTCSVPPVQDSITVFIPTYAPLSVIASPDIAIPCLGTDTVSLASVTGGNGTYTYSWSNGGSILDTTTAMEVPASDTTYYVLTVAEGCGHTASDSVRVSTVPLPDIAILSWDTTVFCIGDTVVLHPYGVTGGNGVYSYAWMNDTGAVVSTADTLLVGVPTDSTYTLHVMDQCGYSTDSLFHTIIPHYAPFTLELPADTTICTGDQISLQAMVNGGSGVYTLNWEGLGWSDPTFTYAGDQDKTFVVDVLDHCGQYISDSMTVIVQHPVTRILIANQGEDDWLFQATTVPFSVPVMIWDLGDGTIVKATSTTHSYLNLEDHWVTLHTVSAEGCPAEDSLLVQAPATLYFPNAFTPDGDGVNDTFGPKGISIERFSMEIYDRWGHLVYSTIDIDKPWDGRVNGGDDATTGVYVYHYSAKGHYFEAREGYGSVTLVRGSTGGR